MGKVRSSDAMRSWRNGQVRTQDQDSHRDDNEEVTASGSDYGSSESSFRRYGADSITAV